MGNGQPSRSFVHLPWSVLFSARRWLAIALAGDKGIMDQLSHSNPTKSRPAPSQPNTLASLSQGWVSPVSSLLDALTRLHLSPETVPEPGSKPAFLHAQEDARWLHHQDEGEEVGRTHGSCAKQGLLRRVLPEWAPLRGEARTRCPDPAGSPSPPSSPSQPPGPPALPRTPAL